MAHNRTDSDSSHSDESGASSTLTSVFDFDMYDAITRRLDLETADSDLSDATFSAKSLIREMELCGGELNFYCPPIWTTKPQTLHSVLDSMLECADHDEGRRYVLQAIIACGSPGNDSGKTPKERSDLVIGHLRSLAITWLSNLLYIFKAGSKAHETIGSRTLTEAISDLVTPTKQLTELAISSEDVGERTDNRAAVLKRDNWTCFMTGHIDQEHPVPHPGVVRFQLNASHIIKRAVTKFNPKNCEATDSAATTLDILQHYTHMSPEMLSSLETRAEHPSNKLTLSPDMRQQWDSFQFCLKPHPNGKQHHYRVHFFVPALRALVQALRALNNFPPLNITNDVVFTKPPGIPVMNMPDSAFIHVHATVACVLDRSGAGKFFDELLQRHPPPKNGPAIVAWEDFQRHVEARTAVAHFPNLIYATA